LVEQLVSCYISGPYIAWPHYNTNTNPIRRASSQFVKRSTRYKVNSSHDVIQLKATCHTAQSTHHRVTITVSAETLTKCI